MSIVASALLVGVTTAAFVGGTPVAAQTVDPGVFSGYSTGTVVHADALSSGVAAVLDTDLAFSGASVASKGSVPQILNEVNQPVQPALTADQRSYGEGFGLELGVGTTVTDVGLLNGLLKQRSTATAPPSTQLITNDIGPIKIDPAAYAALLRGQAQARWADDKTCLLGEDLSTGLGYAADAQLLNLGPASPGDEPFPGAAVAADAPAIPGSSTPARAVSQSKSVTRLVPQTNAAGALIGNNFALMTETRMTIAPVTLLQNTPSPITIEFLGEWVLRTVATGIPGQAQVHYGPGAVNPQTPVLSIIQGTAINRVISLQDLLGTAGLGPIDVGGILNIAVGEDPRAIGTTAESAPTMSADGTVAAAAVDVVRVQLLKPPAGTAGLLPLTGLDLRIGHMESRAQVPPGGVKCSLPVSKVSDKTNVDAGDSFTYSITVTNPFADCELTNVRVEDNITVTQGVRYNITGTNPAASSQTANQVVWNDIGPIGPKQSKTVTISIAIPAGSAAGQFTNNAKATGNCATGSAQGGAKITVPITGETTVVVPSVRGGRAAELPATDVAVLPRTGSSGPAMALTGLALLGAALGLRRFRAHSVR